jgi:diaminobutyrate-2-oxoglutarate transaminase
MNIFKELESDVQCYARSFPVIFDVARGPYLYDESGEPYLDFLSGAGSLNYGHNNPVLKQALLDYIQSDGVAHSLDMHTRAKKEFLQTFRDIILAPRAMDYRLQFPGPTGTNAVEAALKLARKVTGRTNVIAFTNAFHGVTMGAVAATANTHHRGGAGAPLAHITRMPYCGYYGSNTDTIRLIDKLISDTSSGVDLPAAVILETVQGEGGLNVAEKTWLQALEKLCHKHKVLMIVDDIQAGCGRTGPFFSFETSGIRPDIITLSKSLSGYGLPMALVLLKPELDQWAPGEHNGTFRGNNHAFITATAALKHYWRDAAFSEEISHKAQLVTKKLKDISDALGAIQARVKGRGLMQGLQFPNGEMASKISRSAFDKKLIVETAGSQGQVVKCFCPLTISEEELTEGLRRLRAAVYEIFDEEAREYHRNYKIS